MNAAEYPAVVLFAVLWMIGAVTAIREIKCRLAVRRRNRILHHYGPDREY